MRKCHVLSILLFFPASIFSQQFTINFRYSQANLAFSGFRNPFILIVENASCNSIRIQTDLGKIEKVSACEYIFYPSHSGSATFTIGLAEKGKNKKIGVWYVNVKDFPDVVAKVGGKTGGPITKKALDAQYGISANMIPSMGFDLNFTVKSFILTAFRQTKMLFSHNSESNAFGAEIHQFFKTLTKDDRVVFSSILVLMPDQKTIYAKPLEFVIE